MKIISTFAMFRPRTKHIISIDGIFYARLVAVFAKIRGCLYPCCCHRNMLAFLVEQRDWTAFFMSTIVIFISKMTKNNEITSKANNSSHTCTQTGRNTVSVSVQTEQTSPNFDAFLKELQRRFNVEKNEKNLLYHFILSQGLLEDFAEFSRTNSGAKNFESCKNLLNF